MASLNKVMLIGNLGKDPQVRTFDNTGNKVANFSIATSTRDRDGNEKTEWHEIAAWKNLADIAEKYLRKGSQVFIEGKLQYRTYTDSNNQQRTRTEIVADNLVMLGGRSERSTDNGGSNYSNFNQQPAAVANESAQFDNKGSGDDDLPF